MELVKHGFDNTRITDLELDSKGTVVITRMTNNPNFADAESRLLELKTAHLAYKNSLVEAAQGARVDVAIKRAARKSFAKLLSDMAMYVNQIAKGDKGVLLSSGFDLVKKAEGSKPLSPPENLRVEPGEQKGSLLVRFKRVVGARSYILELQNLSTKEGPEAQQVYCTKTSHFFYDLTRGNEYSIRVMAVGTHPARNWSGGVTGFVG